MGLLGSYKSAVGGLYSNMLNPSGYLQNNDVGYYVPFLNQGKIAQENLEYQKQQQAYNMSIQDRIFGREDTSIARRVADLKASGLSPVLAAGQGAGTGQTVNITAPELGNYPDMASAAMALMQMEANIDKTRAEQEYIELQKSKVPAEISNLKANAYNTMQTGRANKVNADVVSESGVPGTSMPGKIVNDAYGAVKKAADAVKSGWNSYDQMMYDLKQKAKGAVKSRSNYQIPKQPYKPEKKTGYEKRY